MFVQQKCHIRPKTINILSSRFSSLQYALKYHTFATQIEIFLGLTSQNRAQDPAASEGDD
jgi:hypothetical protein